MVAKPGVSLLPHWVTTCSTATSISIMSQSSGDDIWGSREFNPATCWDGEEAGSGSSLSYFKDTSGLMDSLPKKLYT